MSNLNIKQKAKEVLVTFFDLDLSSPNPKPIYLDGEGIELLSDAFEQVFERVLRNEKEIQQ